MKTSHRIKKKSLKKSFSINYLIYFQSLEKYEI